MQNRKIVVVLGIFFCVQELFFKMESIVIYKAIMEGIYSGECYCFFQVVQKLGYNGGQYNRRGGDKIQYLRGLKIVII